MSEQARRLLNHRLWSEDIRATWQTWNFYQELARIEANNIFWGVYG